MNAKYAHKLSGRSFEKWAQRTMSWSGLKENCKERWQRAKQALAIAAERRSCFSNSALMEKRYEEMDGSEEHI